MQLIRKRAILTAVCICSLAFIAAPDEALASCGDYLANHASMPMPETQNLAQDQNQRPAPESPCQGANCQRGLPSVPSTPVDLPTIEFDESAFATCGVTDRRPVKSSFLNDPRNATLNGAQMRVDRPPQA